ncbi:HAD family hydrolase [Cohnella thailandensis]|uniref:HAD family hydrolase n=1 Tax=Cohnella thailandensis TaxID=557557 RepID=A0A841T2G6_9BACL|nr:HAD family hydrolase [Cohnella thailandensis]MBB6635281.1 HAD family hydrolase [Cohnella thailandensis]MBP1974656.1 HAD superfamily hydrolase (TIGR01509 family) [Cohnella thailandensis]
MRAFIFDMDGVIIDSEPIHFRLDTATMEHYGVAIAPHELERFVGMTNPEMWAILKEQYKLAPDSTEIIEYQLGTKIEYVQSATMSPIEGIPELLAELKGKQIRIGLASSSPIRFIEAVLHRFKLQELFDCIVSGEEVERGKPEPDVYLEAARQLGVEPKECIVLEDSRNGVRAAKSAGMSCIGFANPNSGNQDLSLADAIVHSIREINSLFMEELSRKGG